MDLDLGIRQTPILKQTCVLINKGTVLEIKFYSILGNVYKMNMNLGEII